MLWDTFMFRDELDMLEARLTELEDSPVYRHVLVEATTTHTGIPKPLYYDGNKERYARWADRIVHVIADVSNEPHPWAMEHAQRNHIWAAIADADPDDIVILGDVDEIPSPRLSRQPRPRPSPSTCGGASSRSTGNAPAGSGAPCRRLPVTCVASRTSRRCGTPGRRSRRSQPAGST